MANETTATEGLAGDPGQTDRPGAINAVPVRHPGRWIAVIVILVLLAELVHVLLTNPGLNWSFIWQVMTQQPVLQGLLVGTLVGTFAAMILAVIGGVILAIMRLSDNIVLSLTAGAYIWFFRSIPRYVLLFIMGLLGYLFPPSRGGLGVGIPFGPQVMHLFGVDANMQFFSLNANNLFSSLLGGIIGLALSESAYMAEIARAGILSVDEGQHEAASALGMSRGLSMRRIVLPQAMRVIVPPTGNETIAMLKDTSLLIAIPVTNELFFQTSAIGARLFRSFETAVAASLWYLVVCSVLMYIQMHIERYFGRGIGTKKPPAKDQKTRAKLLGLAGGGPR